MTAPIEGRRKAVDSSQQCEYGQCEKRFQLFVRMGDRVWRFCVAHREMMLPAVGYQVHAHGKVEPQ